MSGIVALLNLDGAPVDRALLEELTSFLAFRGPDAQRTWCSRETGGPEAAVGLGHALLQTAEDCDAEHQPLSADGRVWITADARVDGRSELIEKLRGKGRLVPDGAPDGELILHAYHVWGEECVQHLIGDFAFAVWDEVRRRLFCASDHFGVVPLYYVSSSRHLICSNTLDCLRRCPGVSGAFDDQSIADFLIFAGSQDQSATMFADVRRLPPAHTLTWSDGTLRLRRYWEVPGQDGYLRYKRAEEYVEHFTELLTRAVADRLRARRAGVLMSGGLDSTSVAATAQRVLAASGERYDLRAYTWVFDWAMPDEERRYAVLVADALGLPIEYMSSERSLLEDPRGHVDPVLPVPHGFSHPYDARAPLRRIATYARVAFTGMGGDSAVYPDPTHWFRRLRAGQLGPAAADVREHVRLHGRRPPLYVRTNLHRWLGRRGWRPPYPTWLRPDFAARLSLRARLDGMTDERVSDCARSGMTKSFWTNILTRYDPGHSALPVKVCHPFFDVRLITYLVAVPAVPWFVRKTLIKSAMRGKLPEPVLRRRKTPLADWPYHALALKQGVPGWMDALAAAPALESYVDRDALGWALRSPGEAGAYEYQAAVRALVLADWLEKAARSGAVPRAKGEGEPLAWGRPTWSTHTPTSEEEDHGHDAREVAAR